jgi:hypothetical protein
LKTYEDEKLPTEREGDPSLLNEIQKHGMLTYEDFCFLLNILATPRRYMDIAFHCFNIRADGNIDPKEYVFDVVTYTYSFGSMFPSALILKQWNAMSIYLRGVARMLRRKQKSSYVSMPCF